MQCRPRCDAAFRVAMKRRVESLSESSDAPLIKIAAQSSRSPHKIDCSAEGLRILVQNKCPCARKKTAGLSCFGSFQMPQMIDKIMTHRKALVQMHKFDQDQMASLPNTHKPSSHVHTCKCHRASLFLSIQSHLFSWFLSSLHGSYSPLACHLLIKTVPNAFSTEVS